MKAIPPIAVLQAFEAVARLGSFAKAAAELHVTRSAISHRMQLLEDLLGAAVLQRHAGATRLTPSGAAYLISVRHAIEALDRVALDTGASAARRRLRLSTPPSFGRLKLLPVLPDLLARHPDLTLTVDLALSQLDDQAGAVDVAIRFGTGRYGALESHRIQPDRIVAVASSRYAEQRALFEPCNLLPGDLLLSRLEPWRPWLAAAGIAWEEPTGGHYFEDISLLYDAAAAGLGVALARSSLVRPWLENGRLSQLFPITAASPYAYYLLHTRSGAFGAEVETLLGLLRDDDVDPIPAAVGTTALP